MTDRVITVGTIRLQVQDHEHDGEAIVFLHFGGGNLMMWGGIIPVLQDRFRLVTVDLRGHGKSTRPRAGYHIDTMAQDIAGVMEELDIKKAHIVGSSLGAEVGLSLAAFYPGKVISLLCEGALYSEFGPYGIFEGSEAEFKSFVEGEIENERQREPQRFDSLDALMAEQEAVNRKYDTWNEYVKAYERYGAFRGDDGRYTIGMGKEELLDYMSYYYFYHFEDYYRKVTCPILMLPGQENLENEREKSVMLKLQEIAGEAEIAEIEGWMHAYGWMVKPEEAGKLIVDFIGNVRI